jgi:hypothetical protein
VQHTWVFAQLEKLNDSFLVLASFVVHCKNSIQISYTFQISGLCRRILRSSFVWDVYAPCDDGYLSTFRDSLSIPSSRIKQSLNLKMRPIDRPETSVTTTNLRHVTSQKSADVKLHIASDDWEKQLKTGAFSFCVCGEELWKFDSSLSKWCLWIFQSVIHNN